MEPWGSLLKFIERDGAAALVTIARADGSTPREIGARMVVARNGDIAGSIGGGPLEWNAIDLARQLIGSGRRAEWKTVSLGPALDQCCGGRAELLHESFGDEDRAWIEPLAREHAAELVVRAERSADGIYRRRIVRAPPPDTPFRRDSDGSLLERFGEMRSPVYLFGAGHVGRALVGALAPLPFAVRWIDSRPEAFVPPTPATVRTAVSALPEAELADAPAGSLIVVMTHSHALDLAIVTAALGAGRFPYVGLIGSATKRALFERRLAEFGVPTEAIARLVCPIGVAGISGKSPAVIAAAVAAELLIAREAAPTYQKQWEVALG